MAHVGSNNFWTDDASDNERQHGGVPGRNNRFRQILKLPGFYHKEPRVWFAEIELLFDYAGVVTQKTIRDINDD